PQPQPTPPPPQPQPRVEQPPPQPRQTVQAQVPEPKPVRRRPDVDVNLNQVVTRNTSTSKPADPTPAPVQPSVNNSVVRDLRRNLSSSMEIPTPTGGGGEAYINYALLVKAEYERAWDKPARIDDDSAAVRVRVTIARNGDVLSAEILKRSGVSTLDNSVQRALALRKLPPFPPEARDAKRTFVIIFKLTSN
ncbi:MAG TPA: energy transducer TonB, partial [Methylomirabilota bacterium]|nr:energy transducer TonB [Methylomirabilota bacterium]